MSQKIFGYIRVSTAEQNIARQEEKMKNLGIDERDIYIDYASGRDFNRSQYQNMKSRIRKADLIYVDALDRLGRDYEAIISEWKEITRELEADIIVLENSSLFDSRKFRAMNNEDSQLGSLMEDQFLSLLSYVADQERKKILKRQKEGITAAKKAGKHLGRPRINLSTLTQKQLICLDENYERWKNQEIKSVTFMEKLDLKKNTFYKIIKEYELNKK